MPPTSRPIRNVWRLRVERESLRQPALQDKLQAALCAELLGTAAARWSWKPARRTDSPALRDQWLRSAGAPAAPPSKSFFEDPLVQQLLSQFKTARIVPGSIKPH